MNKIPYSKKLCIGKHFIAMNMGRYNIYKYVKVSDPDNEYAPGNMTTKVKDFPGRKEFYADADKFVAEQNDWQALKYEEVFRAKQDSEFAKAYQYQPYEHIWLHDKKMYFFIWDTRELTKVASADYDHDKLKQFLIPADDNGKPITKDGKWLNLSDLLSQPINYKTPKESK
jgi:hypothetical protein